jgi:hypothetical protein
MSMPRAKKPFHLPQTEGESEILIRKAGASGFASIYFDLFKKLDNSVCFSDIDDRDIGDDTGNEQQATNNILHHNLLG